MHASTCFIPWISNLDHPVPSKLGTDPGLVLRVLGAAPMTFDLGSYDVTTNPYVMISSWLKYLCSSPVLLWLLPR